LWILAPLPIEVALLALALQAFGRLLGAGAAVAGAVLGGRLRGGVARSPLLHPTEVDDLAHATMLRCHARPRKGGNGMGTAIKLTASDGHTLSAWRTGPDNATRGLVVVQEIFGVNHHIRNVCERFAAHGFAVVAPALFDRVRPGIELGYTPQDIEQGREIRAKVPEAGTMADIEAAARALGGKAIGIVGYCWGGTVAWWGATRTTHFKAASCWYGGGIAATRTERPNCPVQMHFGDQDGSIPMNDVEAIRAAQPKVEIYVYQGAGHGFGCDERGSFNKQAADLAQQRTLAFFNAHLSG
jgi:carboxymethylenebutenolidase